MLAWGMTEFNEGYKFAGEYFNGLEAIKWVIDYFIRCHTGNSLMFIFSLVQKLYQVRSLDDILL